MLTVYTSKPTGTGQAALAKRHYEAECESELAQLSNKLGRDFTFGQELGLMVGCEKLHQGETLQEIAAEYGTTVEEQAAKVGMTAEEVQALVEQIVPSQPQKRDTGMRYEMQARDEISEDEPGDCFRCGKLCRNF